MRLQCDYVGYPKIWQETKDELQFVNDIVVRKNSVFCLLGLFEYYKKISNIIYLLFEMIILVL